jgi:hypothetical protein
VHDEFHGAVAEFQDNKQLPQPAHGNVLCVVLLRVPSVAAS